jgi:aminoglycoside phosphotransferase (APT) family kinase protein
MTLPDRCPLNENTARDLLETIAPGSDLLSIALTPGSYSNFTHFVTASDAQGNEFCIVVRRYQVFGNYDRGEKARREFTALQYACQNGIPAPQPIYLDETGDLLGIPGIVTRYVSGEQVQSPSDPLAWARMMAQTLAKIHVTPCDPATRAILMDANAECTWFLRSESTPEPMRVHPDGERIWKAMQAGFPNLQPVAPALAHTDYWSGNILWDGEQISAVADWEEAAYGDPASDVAYCRMDMILLGMPEAADEFLSAYETAIGHRLANLGFWELAAAARAMYTPEGWIDQSPSKERFAQFIADGEQRMSAPQNKAELLAGIHRSWELFNQFIAGRDLTTPDAGGWTIADNLAHITEWERFVLRNQFQGMPPAEAIGLPPTSITPFDVDQVNALLFERNRQRPPADVLAEFHAIHAQLLAAIEASSEEALMKPPRIFDDGVTSVLIWTNNNTRDHYDEHLQTIVGQN